MDLQNQVKPRKFLTPDQKFKIVKEQMMTKTSVADICKKYDIVPSAFCRYQEQFLAGALEAFKSPKDGPTKEVYLYFFRKIKKHTMLIILKTISQ
jgi:hypothetical protein